jgi:hypothetical protein
MRSGVHGGLQTSSGSTVSTPGSARTVSTMPCVISGPAGQAGEVSDYETFTVPGLGNVTS